jgi:hypothetical protein
MDPSTEHDASSEISTGSVDPSLSAGLLLPIELRLMLYAHLTKVVYRKLPIHHKNTVFIYWPYIGMPSDPACSSRELHSDLQAYLAEVRRKSDLPDIIVRGQASPVLIDLLSSISMVARMDSVGGKEREDTLLSRLLRHYAEGGKPVEGPKNPHQPHGTAARSQITTAQGNAHPPLLISSRSDEVFDVELLHSFVCAVMSRLSVPDNDTVHLRIIITDRPARGDSLAVSLIGGQTVRAIALTMTHCSYHLMYVPSL